MRKLCVFLCLTLLLTSCYENESSTSKNDKSIEKLNTSKVNEAYLEKFAGILSKVTFERKDVRSFLKEEALKLFDKNYDVLYYLIKDKKIGEDSFRNILISSSSKEEIEKIERNVPLLNILIPEIVFFDIAPKNLNVEDNEIPVVISKEETTEFYINGEKELSVDKGQVPDFHVFVVNENSRVLIPEGETRGDGVEKKVIFKSPNFDGSLENESMHYSRSSSNGRSSLGGKAALAYSYFYKDDNSIQQKAFQRDYIYYGITPKKRKGSLNHNVSEYISFIEINPNTYFKISDQKKTKSMNDDPYILKDVVVQRKKRLSQEELIDRMWTKGAYDFKFEIITSTNQHPNIVYVPLRPSEIWDFNIEHKRVRPNFFRRSKNTYTINPNKFTAKRVYLNSQNITFGKWHLAQESVYRYVNIYEEDEGVETIISDTYESVRVHEKKFNGDIKLQIGFGDNNSITGGGSSDVTNSNTTRETKTVNITRREKSDDLGSVKIYFYDPIITGKSGSNYIQKTYNTEHVMFGLSVR